MLTVLVELRRIVALLSVHSAVGLWVVHILLLVLMSVLLTLMTLLFLDHELEHLKLVLLECAHVLHLLLMDAFGLLEHAAVVALRLGLLDLDHTLALFTIALRRLDRLNRRCSECLTVLLVFDR